MIGAAASLWVAVYAACATIAVARLASRTRRPVPERRADGLTDVVLVRPCAGSEAGLAGRLTSSGGAEHVVVAVGSFADAATPAAGTAVVALRQAGVHADLVETRAVGPNHKVDQLARALALAPAARDRAIVVVADSDVDLDGVDLARLVAELDDPGVGVVWAPPIEAGDVVATGDAVSHAVLGASLHAFPLLSGIDPNGMVGKLFAIRRSTLEAIGGFEALRAHLGEDMELARRVRALSLRVVASPLVARSRAGGRALSAVHARYVRWLQVVRAQRTALLAFYPFLLAPAPMLLFAAICGALGDHPTVVVASALGVLVRVAVAMVARRAAGLPPAPLLAIGQALVGDLALLGALVGAVSSRRVSWRAGTMVLGPGGKLLPAETAENAP